MKSRKGKTLTKKMHEAFKESAHKTLDSIPNIESWKRVRQQLINDNTFPKELYNDAMEVLDEIAKDRGWDIEIAVDSALERLNGIK